MCRPDQLSLLFAMIAMVGAFMAESAPAYSQVLTFAGEQTGALPKTFETALTGQGQAGRWEVSRIPRRMMAGRSPS